MAEAENTAEEQYSAYLQYLPALYREDDFAGRFLHIFEDIIKPIEGIIDNLAYYFDPGMTPSSFLPWLAFWVGLGLDERWPEVRRRQLLKSVVELYRWRGTKRGLSEYLRIYTGVAPQIIEPIYAPAMRLGSDTQLGTPLQLGATGAAHCFTVVVNVAEPATIDADIIRMIIEIQKPAHAAYILTIGGQKSNI